MEPAADSNGATRGDTCHLDVADRFGVHGSGNLREAVDAPNFDSGPYPTSFYPRTAKPVTLRVERGIGADVLAEMGRRGHSLEVQDGWSIGNVCAVAREEDGTLRAAANPRDVKSYAAGR